MAKEKGRKIIHEGNLELNGLDISCYVLEDGTRVLSNRGMQNALKLTDASTVNDTAKLSGVELSRFVGGKWFNSLLESKDRLEKFKPITCYKGAQKINGYEATVLADLCDLLLEARKNKLLKTERQFIVADQCEILMRSFAKVGIIALVDEATGYQYDRERYELQRILKSYISEELLPWQKRFPDEFYKEIFRLNGWGHFMSGNINIKDRPGVIGHWTKKFVYSILPKGVLTALLEVTERNTKGRLRHKLHQRLTKEEGTAHLNKVLVSVVTIMNLSDSWAEFEMLWNKKYGQQQLAFNERNLLEPSKNKTETELSQFNQNLQKALAYKPKI